jgi:hypothetical protein
MPKILKKFDITISKKFPDGSLASIAYGTSWEDIFDVVKENTEQKLFELAHQSTLADIKNSSKIDPLVRSVWRQIGQQLANERLVENAEHKNRAKKEKNKHIR